MTVVVLCVYIYWVKNFKNSPKHIWIFDYCCLMSSDHFRPMGHVSLFHFCSFFVCSCFDVHSVMFHLDYLNVGLSWTPWRLHSKFQQYIVFQFQVRSWIICWISFISHTIRMFYCLTSGSRPFQKYFATYWLQSIDMIRNKMEIIIRKWFSFHIIIAIKR